MQDLLGNLNLGAVLTGGQQLRSLRSPTRIRRLLKLLWLGIPSAVLKQSQGETPTLKYWTQILKSLQLLDNLFPAVTVLTLFSIYKNLCGTGFQELTLSR